MNFIDRLPNRHLTSDFVLIPVVPTGAAATDLVAFLHFGRKVSWKAGKIVKVTPNEAFDRKKHFDCSGEIVHAARAVGATFGDSA
jgi:hypothetical protein